MNKKLLLVYLVVAILGLADAVYLTYMRFAGMTPPCSISIFSGCAIVERSKYSVLFGIPLSVYGVVFYSLSIIASCILLVKTIRFGKEILGLISLAGLISSLYFLYLQAFVIQAFCLYCVISGAATLILFILASIFFLKK